MMKNTLNKLKEPSTWAGLGVLIGLVGLHLPEGGLDQIAAAVIALIGVYEVFRKEWT